MIETPALAPVGSKPSYAYCKECGAYFCRIRSTQEFCVPAHRQSFNGRRMLGGLKLYDAAIQWRIERPQGALSELGAIVDDLANDERERRRKRKEAITAHKAALKAQRAAR